MVLVMVSMPKSYGVLLETLHSAWGFGLDAGIQYHSENDWKFGIMARDITTTYNAWAIDEDKFEPD